jgi:RNA polymerase-binding transcription factor DksA
MVSQKSGLDGKALAGMSGLTREANIDMTPAAKKATPAKKVAQKKSADKKALPAKKVAPVKKAEVKKLVAKKAVKPVPAQKATAKKVAPAKKEAAVKKAAPAKKSNERSPNIVKPTLAKKAPAKKAPAKPFPAKLQSTTTGDSTTFTVTPREVNTGPEVVIEERRLVMTPPPRPVKSSKRAHTLKPIKGAPAPLVVNENENPWTAAELKAMRTELNKELIRLKAELSEAEGEMEDLISAAGVGAGDDQADAGTKTFEREHEMSLVYNARDMVLQTERAIERIDNKTYGRCEECGNAIGKARLQVFPRATLCMSCTQKEERR